MGVVRCIRCDSYIDLDYHVEDVIYINNESVCVECATEEEVDTFERECEEESKRKSAIWRKRNMKAINIILDESGVSPDVLFVEIETDEGRSIRIGERIKYGKFAKIRITSEDIEKADAWHHRKVAH